jgi:hypothetical protein
MDVTIAIVGFILVCVVLPHIIKWKAQFYAAFAVVLISILLHSLGDMFPGENKRFQQVMNGLVGLLNIMALILLMMAAGGLRLRELAGEVANAYEVMRRGETEKTVVIPLGGQKARAQPEEPPRQRYAVDEEPRQAAHPPKDEGGGIPVE